MESQSQELKKQQLDSTNERKIPNKIEITAKVLNKIENTAKAPNRIED